MSDHKGTELSTKKDNDDDDRGHRSSKHRKHRDDESDSKDSHDRRHGKHRKHRKRKSSSSSKQRREKDYSDSEDSDSDDGGDRRERKRERKHRKKSSKKSSRRHRDGDNDDSSDSDSSRSHDRKRKKSKKKHKKRKKTSKKDSDSDESNGDTPTFGKYGILKAGDMNRMQRTFEIWMAEVKGIPSFSGPRYELVEYFAEFAEDFNTATMPHKKYYDYDAWEMQEYQNAKVAAMQKGSKSAAFADEFQHAESMKQQATVKQQQAKDLLLSTMSREKVLSMKRQKDLQAQMQVAYKTGNMGEYDRLKKKLEPEA